MQSKWGFILLTAFLLLLVSGPTLRAGDDGVSERTHLELARADLSSAATSLTEVMKAKIDAGKLDEVEDLMGLLRRVLALRGEIEARISGLQAPAPIVPPAVPAAPMGPTLLDEAGRAWFSGRGGHRNLKANGGSALTQGAVDLALEWLSRHQGPDGSWSSAKFGERCVETVCTGPGNAIYDVGTTGLALLAFLGTGQTMGHGNYKLTVMKGISWLISQQDEDGCIGPKATNHFIYCHALATQALVEACALSGDQGIRGAAAKAVEFCLKAQNPYLGWRYGVRPGDTDTSVTVMMISALHAAKMAGFKVGPEPFEGVTNWIEKATEPEYGRVGYTSRGSGPARPQDMLDKFPADKSESLTAAGMLARVLCGQDPRTSEPIQKGMDLLLKAPPTWDEAGGSIDYYYWYFGTQAAFQVGGESWKAWNAAVKPALVDHQEKEGCAKGSFPPVGVWCREGGRVYSTAISALTLETYYRSGRIFERILIRRR
jgi:hypothetical protein